MKKHAQQVAAWGQLSGLCHNLGDVYNPSKESMKGTALDDLLRQSQESVSAVQNAQGALTNAINVRDEYLHRITDIGSRIAGMLTALEFPDYFVSDVNRIRRRFRFQTQPAKDATALKNFPGGQAGETMNGGTSTTMHRKRAQLDVESKIDNFMLLIALLEKGPLYEPDEEDLTINGLNAFVATLKEKQVIVNQAKQKLSSAIQQRNEVLYGPSGIHGRATMIKGYIKGKYGLKDKRFKEIRKIQFWK